MARIPLRSGFTLIPEGTHIFRIYEVDYDEDFGKLEIKMITAEGLKHTERYSLLRNDGTYNEGALNAFSFTAKVALGDYTRDDIDPTELVGYYIKADVVHNSQPNKKDPSKTVTFVNLGNKYEADGFDKEATQEALTIGTTETVNGTTETVNGTPKSSGLDLDALLG